MVTKRHPVGVREMTVWHLTDDFSISVRCPLVTSQLTGYHLAAPAHLLRL